MSTIFWCFGQDEMRIGPKYDPSEYFVIKMAELKTSTGTNKTSKDDHHHPFYWAGFVFIGQN